jgi:hypothetical protein
MGLVRIVSKDGVTPEVFDKDGNPIDLYGVLGIDVSIRATDRPTAVFTMRSASFDIEAVRKDLYQDGDSPFAVVCFWEGKPVNEMTGEDCKDALGWLETQSYSSSMELFGGLVEDRMKELGRAIAI